MVGAIIGLDPYRSTFYASISPTSTRRSWRERAERTYRRADAAV